MIVRDSARTLDECLASVAPWLDEMIIVDTGSTDKSRDIARQHGGKVFEFPWCDDFSAARNESLSHATGHWLFWMDSDDTISPENGRRLKELASGSLDSAPTAYVMQVHCPGPPGTGDVTVVDHVKMFRNDPRLRFEGRIHEQILPAIRRTGGAVEWTDAFVVHSGSEHTLEARSRKQQRDLSLLELDLADRPNHPFVLFNLGMTYGDMDEYDKAIDSLQRCLVVSDPTASHVRKAYALLAGALAAAGRVVDATMAVEKGLSLFQDDPELWFRKGVLAQAASNHQLAIDSYEQALTPSVERQFSSRDRGVTGYKARHNTALAQLALQRPECAELNWRLALEEQPRYVEAWSALAELLLEQRRLVTLAVEIESAASSGGVPDVTLIAFQAKMAKLTGGISSALAIVEEGCQAFDSPPALLKLKCQWLFEDGRIEEAVHDLEQLCRLETSDGANWHNLGVAHQSAGRLALAVQAYERSLGVRPDAVHTLLQLGYCFHGLDRVNVARTVWSRAEEIAPHDAAVRDAIRILEDQAATAA